MTKEKAIPGVVGTKTATREILDGTSLIVDGIHGRVLLSPTPAEIDEYEKKLATMRGKWSRSVF